MILIAVIVGYILGIAPFVVPKIIELKDNKKQEIENKKESKSQEDILYEWLNGKTEEDTKKVNQQDIYEEYVTGKTTKGE